MKSPIFCVTKSFGNAIEVAIAYPQSVISLHDLMPAAALCARHCRNWSS
jgi:hypothetical protein